MKTLLILSLSIALIIPVFALSTSAGQDEDHTKQSDNTTKPLNIPGKISQDGETFVSDTDGEIWIIANPEAIKGHEGDHVLLAAKLDTNKGEVTVVSVTMLKHSKANTKTQK